MKKIYEMMMAMALMGVMMPSGATSKRHTSELTDEEIREKIRNSQTENKRRLLSKGCKEFEMGGVTIIALNKKNAERKYLNYKKQLKSLNI